MEHRSEQRRLSRFLRLGKKRLRGPLRKQTNEMMAAAG